MKISKHYEENVKTGDFIFAKVGITIHSDKEITGAELPEHSKKLGDVAKRLVRAELAVLRQEAEKNIE